MNSEPSSEMLSRELCSTQAKSRAGQARHKAEFRTSPRKRGGDSLNTVRIKLKKTEKQSLVAKDYQPEVKTKHAEDMETDQEEGPSR